MFVFLIIRIKYSVKCFLSRSYTIGIYTLVVVSTPYGKRHISRSEPVLLQQSEHIRLKLTFDPIFLYKYHISSMHSSTRKMPQKITQNISLRHLLVNLKYARVLAPPMLFSIELWRQCQPLIFPPIQASNGALRSVKHERRNVVIRVRGCRMTNIQKELYGMQTQQGVLWSDMLVVQKR